MKTERLKEQLQAVRDWSTAFGVTTSLEALDRQETLMQEEAHEIIQVVSDYPEPSPESLSHFLKEVADGMFVMAGYINMREDLGLEDKEHPVSEETQIALGIAHELVNMVIVDKEDDDLVKEAFNRVVASNMTKLVDGKPLLREDGKVLKGPNYVEPDLSDLGQKLFDTGYSHLADEAPEAQAA